MSDESACRLCDKGFPLVGVDHVGTQALGMIPTTRCTRGKTPLANELVEISGKLAERLTEFRIKHDLSHEGLLMLLLSAAATAPGVGRARKYEHFEKHLKALEGP